MKRKAVLALIAVLLVLVLAGCFVRFSYLRSSRVATQVATHLESLYGGPVRVGEVDVGLGSTTITNFELFEEGGDGAKDAPWLKVASLTADVSLWDIISGNALPKRVTLQGAVLLFRFNRAGDLVTRFPGQPESSEVGDVNAEAVPEAVIEGGTITFRKEGQGDLAIKNVNARLSNKAGNLTLAGTAENAEVGKLTLTGNTLDKNPGSATVQLKTEPKVRVTQSLLDRLPFVPAAVWDEIQIAEADAAAELTLNYDSVKKALQYRVEVTAENTKLSVPAIDLSAHKTSGKVTVADNLVHLRDIEGQAFGGQIRTDADLDFRGAVSKLTFSTIQVDDLDVSALPDDWNIPPLVRKSIAGGKLTGNANLEVTIRSAVHRSDYAARLVGLLAAPPGLGPVQWYPTAAVVAACAGNEVQTKSRGKGQVRDPAGNRAPLGFDWQLAPRRPRSSIPPVKKSAAPLNAARMLASLLTTESILHVQNVKESQKGPTKYLDVDFTLTNASLADVIKNQDVKLPFPVDGTVSFQVQASIPIDRLDDLKAYKAKGSAQVTKLVLAGVKLDEVNADFNFRDGVLYLKSLKSKIAPEMAKDQDGVGTIEGTGSVELAPLGDLRAELHVERIPIARLVDLGGDRIDGSFSGNLTLRAPAEKLQSVAAFAAEGKISSERIEIHGVCVERISTSVRLKNGVVALPDLQGQFEGALVALAGELRLGEDYAFLAKMNVRDWNLASLEKLAIAGKPSLPAFEGAFTTSLDLRGKLNPFQVALSGDAQARNLKIDAFEAQSVRFHWDTDGAKLDLKNVEVQAYNGTATGSAVVPFDPKKAGKIDLRVRGLDVHQLAMDMRVPVRVAGNVDGVLKGTFPPVADGLARTAVVRLDLKAAKMRVQNIPAEEVHARLEYENGALDYKLEGKSLAGTFDLEGQIPPSDQPADGKKGRLRVQGVQVAGLFRALNLQDADHLSGVLKLDVDYTHATPDRYPDGRGVLRVANLRWRDSLLANNLQGDIVLSEQQFRLRDVGGAVGEGAFGAQVTYYLRQQERSWFTLNLQRIESARLLAPWLDNKIEGPIQARIRGHLGATWRGKADFEMARGKVFGVEVTQWRLPVTWSFAPGQNRGTLDIRETSAHVARGRATGKMSLFWESTARIEGSLRLHNVDLQDLLRQIVGPDPFGGGQTTARFDFAGSDVRSLNDIGGTLTASFSQAQALQVPVLQQIAPYLGVGSATTFQKGDLRARLDRGVLRIQRLALRGNNLQLFVDGTVALDERLNLAVVAKVGGLDLSALRLGSAAQRIPVAGPVPLLVLQEATNVLTRHVVYLQVTGTTRSPVIRPRPVAILSQEAVRYFLNRSSLPVTFDP